MEYVGYRRVQDQLRLAVLPVERPAVVGPVTRVEPRETSLAIPRALSPVDTPINHLLFALKHEGTNLALLASACRKLEPASLLEHLRRTPTGAYIRKLCMLWERFTEGQLEDLPAGLGGVPSPLFDPTLYLTSTTVRDKRWRIDWNGLGAWAYCPTVRRTPHVESWLASDFLAEVRQYLNDCPKEKLERVLAWAYVHETRSSYALEGEVPPTGKTEAFAALLRQAYQRSALTEEHYVELQNAAVTGTLAKEATFRFRQNYLSNGAPGALGVTYLPPPAALVPELIHEISRMANLEITADLDPVTRAALVSFGFVFVHPFIDGNGRLSRFLAHYALCQSRALPNGYILPLSTAMKRNEAAYLKALQSFSQPARRLWTVTWLDAEDFEFTFNGDEAIYRYWDATLCVEFMGEMGREALRKDLRDEVEFLNCHDQVTREVNQEYDVAGSTLSKLIVMIHQNGGVLSKHRRKQFADQVDSAALDFIEARVKHCRQV
jgi:hypothetical protein